MILSLEDELEITQEEQDVADQIDNNGQANRGKVRDRGSRTAG